MDPPEGPAPIFANTDGIITSTSTTIAINKLSDSFPRPSARTSRQGAPLNLPSITVHSLPRQKSSETSLEAIGDSLAHLGGPGRGLRSSQATPLMKSGRMSAEPTPLKSHPDYRLSAALNALDLDNLDFRSIDPVLASKLLDEIRHGADIGPLLEKLKDKSGKNKEKMVTFEDETITPKLNPDDVFM